MLWLDDCMTFYIFIFFTKPGSQPTQELIFQGDTNRLDVKWSYFSGSYDLLGKLKNRTSRPITSFYINPIRVTLKNQFLGLLATGFLEGNKIVKSHSDFKPEHKPIAELRLIILARFSYVLETIKKNFAIFCFSYVGNTQIPLACEMFIELKGIELLQKNLYTNFMMHLCNLFDYDVISPEDYFKSVKKLQKLLSNHDEGRKVITDARGRQLE